MINTTRRTLISALLALPGMALLLRPLLALAEWNIDAFTSPSVEKALAELFPGLPVTPAPANTIRIGVESRIENGAVVPVKISSDLEPVQSITILVEKNPNPLVAHFELMPRCQGYVATRIKMAQPSDIIAVVRSGDRLYTARRFVEVLKGGCG